MRTKEINLYQIEEIKEQFPALFKEILEKNRYFNTDFDWYADTLSTVQESLEALGFSNIEIHFSGFGSQGDGANFTASWSYAKDWKEAGFMESFRPLAEALDSLKERSFKITKGNSRYSHENTVDFTFYDKEGEETDEDESIVRACKYAMQIIYSELEKEYDYLTSEEAIFETLEANEYWFNEKGDIEN